MMTTMELKILKKKDNNNRISVHVYGIHKDIKNHCQDGLVGEYVNNIDERDN